VPARFSEADCEFSGLQQKKKKETSLSLLCFLLLFLQQMELACCNARMVSTPERWMEEERGSA
jgi:hypothetical protein